MKTPILKMTNIVKEFPGVKALDGVNIENISESEISDFSLQVKNLYQDIMQFTNVLTFGQTSIQLVTQNKSFACSIIILDNNDNFCFMAMLYGY